MFTKCTTYVRTDFLVSGFEALTADVMMSYIFWDITPFRLLKINRRFGFPAGEKFSRSAPGPNQPPIQWVPGAVSQELKQPGREADH
jgi:hypothetical protein